jgi:ureidoacrylate peracid hydrolase
MADQPKSAITLHAKPEAIGIDPTRTAVIVVDMQNDFGSKGGMFDLAGIDISVIRRVIAPTTRVLDSARRKGLKIIYLKMGFRPDLSDLGAPDSPNHMRHMRLGVGNTVRAPNGTEGRVLVRDTWNTDILSELQPHTGDVVIYKHRYSGFYQTDLHARLQELGMKYLIFVGCTTSVCVESTARDAMFRDYACVLLADCVGERLGNSLTRSNHEASLLVMQTLFGWVSSSEEFVKTFGEQPITEHEIMNRHSGV